MFKAAVWVGYGSSTLRCSLIRGLSNIPSFPFDVRDFEQRDVVLEANSIEVIQREIAFHRLPKVLDSQIKASQFGCFHVDTRYSMLLFYQSHVAYQYGRPL